MKITKAVPSTLQLCFALERVVNLLEMLRNKYVSN